MKKLTKIIAATGIVAGLGVAGLPLVSYADTAQVVTVKLSVSDTISLAMTGDGEVDFGTLAPGDIKNAGNDGEGNPVVLTVTSNYRDGWHVNASGDSLKLNGTSTDKQITFGEVAQGASHYGIKAGDGESFTNQTNVISSKTYTDADGENFNVAFAVSIASDQPTGDYSGTITFTAANGAAQ